MELFEERQREAEFWGVGEVFMKLCFRGSEALRGCATRSELHAEPGPRSLLELQLRTLGILFRHLGPALLLRFFWGKKTPPCSALAAFADRPELFLKELKAHSNGRGKVRSFLTKAFAARLPLKNKAGCTELFRANFTARPGDQTVGFVLFQQVGDPGSI